MGNLKYNKPIDKLQLKEYIDLPLKEKVKLSEEIIIEFYENRVFPKGKEDGKIYIACSFGKDSTVVVDLVRKIYPDIPIVYFNSGLEFPACVELSKQYENVIEVKPEKTMEEIIEEEGYILPIGKAKTRAIRTCRKNISEGKLNGSGIKEMRGDYGEKSFYNYSKHIPVILAPFKISEKCDDYLKKKPSKKFKEENNFTHHYTGVTAEESRMRRVSILSQGFNIMEQYSRPIGHWRETDVLEYILKKGLPLADCYGDIILNKNGKYKTSLINRTGCFCCPAGSHLRNPNQYQILYDYDYDLWDYSINKLGFKQVLDYFNIPYYPERLLEKEKEKEIREELKKSKNNLDRYYEN